MPRGGDYFRSRRVKKGEVERPWLDNPDPRERWGNVFPLVGLILGLMMTGLFVWDGVRSVPVHKYCEVFSDDFSTWNTSVWTKEVELGGYGNGQFEMTTDTDENVFIEEGVLVIKPTLQEELLMETNHVVDLRGHGCTGERWTDCVATTNTTNGTVINPVKSGRINTKKGASIKYGRIEVVAKLPGGDWLWPAVWMLPKYEVYGEWPRSGEIDILESRGNNASYGQGGNNIITSTMHFGPSPQFDGWWHNVFMNQALRTTFSDDYNTFGIEWSEKYIFTYINSRLRQVMFKTFNKPFWDHGQFPVADRNGTRLNNPWELTGSKASPFDQDFYLVLDVAVGGTNGWFEDGKSGKPWIDKSPLAKKDFWDKRDQWYPTWQQDGQMKVKSVKMWQQSGYNGCKA
ncbi:concanavalin A-like lectin/glucanase domain-containing protein [Pyrenochaeta sp. MPI-SDFR-AT-0127]|nr:concanavalin A-like lectin/glucanase domain-containing protein [Pyrenochaeta sp. MPI-SDFR-AT-0127]